MNIQDANKKQEFIRDAMPDGWLDYGMELKDAAELLWQQSDSGIRLGVTLNVDHEVQTCFKASGISRPYILLSAFAIENVVKGILVLQEPEHVTSGELSDRLKSHNLLALAEQVNDLELSDAEQFVCKVAQEALPYWGRYPIPLKYQGLKIEEILSEHYREVFLNLHGRLSSSIYYSIRDGWDSGAGPQILKYRSKNFGDSMDMESELF